MRDADADVGPSTEGPGQAHNFAPGYNGTEYSVVEVTKAETGSRDGTHF